MKNLRIGLAAFALAGLVGSAAHAQLIGNQPYQPKFGAMGIANGMSPAYRQAILNRKLLGQQSNPLVRGPGGFLLDVQRQGDQAFLRAPSSPFLVSTTVSGSTFVAGGGVGYGLGASYYASSGQYAAAPEVNQLTWIAMLDTPSSELPWDGVSAGAAAPAPMNVWIGQLGAP
jgi:hypothetical protein